MNRTAFIVLGFLLCAISSLAAFGSRERKSEPATDVKQVEREADSNTDARRKGLEDGVYAEIKTTKGSILLSLETEKTPMTVSNFVGLAEGTIKTSRDGRFYDGLTFHRVIDDFMIQTGCPLGNGTGSPGYKFPDEFHPTLRHDGPGVLSMANSGPGTNGSQFYITHVATPWLDDKHTVFGRVVEGQDVVDSIAQGDRIESVEIIRQGDLATSFYPDDSSFKALVGAAEDKRASMKEEQLQRELDLIEQKWKDLEQSESGLRYSILQKGEGSTSPKMGTEVTVHYTGTLLDGRKFDSSIDRGAPAKFKIGQVIPGWNEALMDMVKGEKRLLVIPPELAYGERGYPDVIPPNAFLVFEVELLDF